MIPPTTAAVAFLYRGIGIVCGTQMGKTAALFNICGEKLDNDAAPCLWIGPTKSNVENVIEPQFDSMVQNCPTLLSKLGLERQKKLLKRIAGTIMRFAWAGSATEIASMPAHTVVIDEVDKCAPIPGHGSVVKQGEARVSNYRHSGGIVVATSSPTEGSVETFKHEQTGLEHWKEANSEDVASEVWKIWQNGTRHEVMVPCPQCGEYFAPRLQYLTGWDEGDSPAKAKRKAKLLHWRCGALIDESHKEAMTQRCLPVAPGQSVVDGKVVGTPPDTEWYTIWISGLLSPWVSWGDSAYQWIEAARSHDEETIRTVINLRFGELFRIKGEAPPWEDVQKISAESPYQAGLIPTGVRKIFLAADVQKDHIVVVVRGWGVEMESWLLHREQLWGETDKIDVWRRFDAFVDKGYCEQPYNAIAVDSGYRTEQVYSFCEKRLSTAYATKGRDSPSKLYSSSDVEVLRNGKKVKRGLKRWVFDHGYFKGWVHDRLRYPQDQPGSWHLFQGIDEDYCRQVVAEQRMRLASGKVHWVKSGTNDFLDAEALQALLAHIENIRYLKPLDDKPAPPPKVRGRRGGGVEV